MAIKLKTFFALGGNLVRFMEYCCGNSNAINGYLSVSYRINKLEFQIIFLFKMWFNFLLLSVDLFRIVPKIQLIVICSGAVIA